MSQVDASGGLQAILNIPSTAKRRMGLRGQRTRCGLRSASFLKNAPPNAARCSSPRRMASSAISRWLQWLMGRALADGFSHGRGEAWAGSTKAASNSQILSASSSIALIPSTRTANATES
jgi:hypothetical protein